MTNDDRSYSVLQARDLKWRESNIMKIPNTDLMAQLGGSPHLGSRLWRLPPYSANTWHRHVDSWELYFVLEGVGRIRIGSTTLTVPRHGSVLVAPDMLRQVFNDTADDALWLIVAAPQEKFSAGSPDPKLIYPEDPRSLPPELAGRIWPPASHG